MRKKLKEYGLSNTETTLLNKENFESFKHSKKKIFVKPRSGLASYGAFLLKQEDRWSKILKIQKHIRADKEYQSAFHDMTDFIAEDYINGIEYSFEIIV